MTLDELVESHYDELNENDLYIWQYIFHHKTECQKMSIQQLAHACNVSHTSIIRFTKKIGLDGYSELKVYLKWSLNKQFDFDSYSMRHSSDELKRTLNVMENRDLDHIFHNIDTAGRIFLFGTGEVQNHAALEFKREFAYRHKIMHVIEGNTELDTVLNNILPDDFFILISLSGDNERVVTLAKYLHKMNIQTLGIARHKRNLLSQYVDDYIGFETSDFHTGFQDKSYCCTGHFFLIVNMLFLRYLEYCSSKESNGSFS